MGGKRLAAGVPPNMLPVAAVDSTAAPTTGCLGSLGSLALMPKEAAAAPPVAVGICGGWGPAAAAAS